MPATDERGRTHPAPAHPHPPASTTELSRRTAPTWTPPAPRCGRMRERAQALFATGDKVAGDAYTAETARPAPGPAGRRTRRRPDHAALLRPAGLRRPPTPSDAGRSYHVGRRHVTDDAGEPLVLDWRAPLSRVVLPGQRPRPAGRRRPAAVRVQRRGADQLRGRAPGPGRGAGHRPAGSSPPRSNAPASGRCATSSPPSSPSRTSWSGPTWPTRSASRARRAPARPRSGCTGPRTCSTCTGSGCAASGVLIVGPNRAFLSYIAAVLPALGEVEVAAVHRGGPGRPGAGPGGRRPGRGRAQARPADGRGAAPRGWTAGSRAPTEPIMVSDGSYRWRIDLEPLRRIVDDDPPGGPAVRHRPGAGPGPGGRAAAAPVRGAPGRLAGRGLAAPDGPRPGR